MLLVCGAEPVVRDPRAQVVHVVVVRVADDPGERAREREVGAALQRGALEAPLAGGPVVGVLVLVLDVEHPGGDRPARDQGGALDEQEGLPADERAPAERPRGERDVGDHHAEEDPPRHPSLREASFEQEDEARADEEHEQGVAVEPIAESPRAGGALVLGERHRVDLPGPAVVEVAGVGVVEGVLALPPAVRREDEEAEQVAPAGVRVPRHEERVVGEVVEERVHPDEEDGRDEAQTDGEPGARLDDRGDDPHADVRRDDARDLPQAAAAVDRPIGCQVLLPRVHANVFASLPEADHGWETSHVTIRELLEAHPQPLTGDLDVVVGCIEACVECASACTSCADADLGESDAQEMVRCIRLCLDCADLCDATGRIVTRRTATDVGVVRAAVQACVTACRACREECERHAAHHEHCRICAEVCARCEQACDDLLASIA
jgi:hypothetical protein